MKRRIAIVGAGLSGLVAAYNLCKNGNTQVIIFERGKEYSKRSVLVESDLAYGEGGAGTIAGGKFCFPPASKGVWIRSQMQVKEFENFENQILRPFGGDGFINGHTEKIEVLHKLNSLFIKNYDSYFLSKTEMQNFVIKLINSVRSMGTTILHNCEFKKWKNNNGKFTVEFFDEDNHKKSDIFDFLIIASGRVSSDSIDKRSGRNHEIFLQNPDLGIRITLPLNNTGVFKNIGKDIKIKAQFGDIGVRTFCVCAGGEKTLVNLNGLRYFDGHFEENITNKVNLGILARSPYIFGYEGAALYCQCLRPYLDSCISLKDFIKYGDKFIKDINIFNDLLISIKQFVVLLQQEHLIEENLDKYPVFMPSVDKLNPVIKTNKNFETKQKNLYVIGDAVGVSRGFIQAMWSAYCASNDIIMKTDEMMEKIVI